MGSGRQNSGHVLHLVSFARAFYRCALRPALGRAVPLYALAILVGGAAMGALARTMSATPLALPIAAAAWVLAATRVCAPLFGAAQTEYLRSLPVVSSTLIGAVIAALLCLDAPWIWLCIATDDPAAAIAGPALTLAGHVALASRRRALLRAYAGILLLAGLSPLVGPAWWLAAPALVLTGAAVPWAWTVAPPARTSRARRRSSTTPWLGIARALAVSVVRTDGELVRRAIALLAVMTAAAALVVRNNALTDCASIEQVCLVVLALGLPMVSIRVGARVLELGWQLGWLYDATGSRRRDRVLGGLAVAGAAGGAIGALHAAAVAMWCDPALTWRLVPIEAAAGAVLGVVTLGASAAAVTRRGVDPLLSIVSVVVTVVVGAFVGADGPRSYPVIGALAVVLAAWLYPRRAIRTAPCS